MAPQLRIVIVEDNYDANVALSRLLERFGYEVAGRAYDGLSGLNMIKATHPDVAILDLAMPSLDGLGLAQRVCREVQPPPKLVALTCFGRELESEAASAGFDSYFCKPADGQALRKTLESFIGNS
jgi:CheY-like chemotaxis protein